MFKGANFHIVRFIICLLVLTYGFEAYIGLVSPGGKTYSPFLERYLNVPAWLTYFICSGAKLLLQLCGFTIQQKAANAINIAGSNGVNIIWACLGFGVMSFWVSFIIAHKARWKQKLAWAAAGCGVITLLNILRIALIALAQHYRWQHFLSVDPHFMFNVATYVAIILMVLWFYRRYKQFEQANFNKA